ncbi:DsbA family protein [Shouchella sp. JSM 1781072]|uniref:DsbA family oxidoreductase n=1 Tax=Bacillaceae TaxID=186817 RepID=UPI000C06A874|nr:MULTISPECIES: DsbA family oxidoreductase [Bacillaceae]UTR06375.1 DsbA family oxidoreductase [Alkalihalobacillus sp. LMS6]
MNVEIWSDIACPFCYIGKRKFEQALEAYDEDVDVTFKSFQLDPNAPKESNESMVSVLAKKYNMPEAKAKEMNSQVTAQAEEVGLHYKLDQVRVVNTLDAHRLSHLAKEQGKMGEVMEKLLDAHFVQGRYVGDRDTLVEIAASVGLSKEEVNGVLDSDRYKDTVEQEQAEGAQIGVQGVPFFVFNRKYAVSGAQPKEAFLQVLQKVKEEEGSTIQVINQGDTCSDGSC